MILSGAVTDGYLYLYDLRKTLPILVSHPLLQDRSHEAFTSFVWASDRCTLYEAVVFVPSRLLPSNRATIFSRPVHLIGGLHIRPGESTASLLWEVHANYADFHAYNRKPWKSVGRLHTTFDTIQPPYLLPMCNENAWVLQKQGDGANKEQLWCAFNLSSRKYLPTRAFRFMGAPWKSDFVNFFTSRPGVYCWFRLGGSWKTMAVEVGPSGKLGFSFGHLPAGKISGEWAFHVSNTMSSLGNALTSRIKGPPQVSLQTPQPSPTQAESVREFLSLLLRLLRHLLKGPPRGGVRNAPHVLT